KGDKPAPEPAPPPAKDKPGEDEKDDEAAAPKKSKSVQPKHEVSTRKGCRRYRWELKDSNKEFWLLGHAEVKILSVVCLIVAMMLFSSLTVHPISMLIITMEISIFSFFILLYSFAINRYIPFILWPISVSKGQWRLPVSKMLIMCVAGVVEGVPGRRSLHIAILNLYILMSLAAFFAFIDVRLQRNHVRGKRVKSICWFLLQERKKDPRRARNQRPAKPPEAARPPEPAKGKK
uniref:CKLF like MARVEL transmembrane domain containing 2 n=1 Tax=Aotus nancymaae TaxID=37293 RepID=A0A2K5E8T7_AOTNA